MADSVDTGIFAAWYATTDDGVVAVDDSGRVVLHSPAASRLTGLAPDDALDRPWDQVLTLPAGLASTIWRVREAGTKVRVVADVLSAQGNVRQAELVVSPWTDVGGHVGVLLLLQDPALLPTQHAGPDLLPGFGSLVGADPAMQRLYRLIEALADTRVPILIEGEPGTGKERIAQLLHARSTRGERPLVQIDCAGPSAAALELEIFGRTAGADPGSGAMLGRIELGHTGTVVLDQVDEISLAIQTRLLRLLDHGTIERANDVAARSVDVRLVATTSASLEGEVRMGRFREELFHRLRTVQFVVPPLRRRRGDIPALVEFFLSRYHPVRFLVAPDAMEVLLAYDWPGNVRELELAIRRVVAARPADHDTGPHTLVAGDLPVEIREPNPDAPREPLTASRAEDRRSQLLRALAAHGGNRTAAARALGIGRATFYRWWREAGLA